MRSVEEAPVVAQTVVAVVTGGEVPLREGPREEEEEAAPALLDRQMKAPGSVVGTG